MLLTHSQINALQLIKEEIILLSHKEENPEKKKAMHDCASFLEKQKLYGNIDPDKLLENISPAGKYIFKSAEIIIK